jgi:hypothetical protein
VYHSVSKEHEANSKEIKNFAVFSFVVPRSVVVEYQCFGGPCCFHLPENHEFYLNRRENLKFRKTEITLSCWKEALPYFKGSQAVQHNLLKFGWKILFKIAASGGQSMRRK